MSSLKRIRASQANGALSHGPKTPEGKRHAAANATRHGLLADCVVLPNESDESFDALLTNHLERFGPVDVVEFGMIEEMCAAYWRMRRSWAIEKRMIEDATAKQDPETDDLGRLSAAFSDLSSQLTLPLLHRYETRLHLIYQRGLHNLLLLRACSEPRTPPYQTNLVPIPDTLDSTPSSD